MKKAETKPKSSKVEKTSVVSVSKKPTKPENKSLQTAPPKKPASAKVDEASLAKKEAASKSKSIISATSKPVKAGLYAPSTAKGPNLKLSHGRPSRRNGRKPKDKTAPKTKTPFKLVQIIPKHKPGSAHMLPAKKEKILMRFGKPTKRVLFTIDFLLKASPTIVYHFITTPSCLVRWFCDAVDITNEYYTFSWNGNIEVAELLDDIEDERLRFTWLDGEDEEDFFEFRISTADITDETILEIVDYAWIDEVEEQKELWRTQVEKLRKETGDA
ncbi:MAG: START-like domain-containing protein [Saprospiraceae bacterium]